MIREMLGIAEGILQDLHNDHNEVADLIERMTDSEDRIERGRLFNEMKHKLLPHLQAEQEVLYQKLQMSQNAESRQFGLEGTSEHEAVERQVGKMSELRDPMSDQWIAELNVLEDLIDHHVDEEESTGFSCARDEFDTDQLERMGREFQTRKAALMTRVA